MPGISSNHQKLGESHETEQTLTKSFQTDMALLTPGFRLPDSKTVKKLLFKPPSLWYFVNSSPRKLIQTTDLICKMDNNNSFKDIMWRLNEIMDKVHCRVWSRISAQ